MKKRRKSTKPQIPEIVSLNEELFSLVSGDPLATLDERLLLVAGGKPLQCDTFTCGSFSGACGSFACGRFSI